MCLHVYSEETTLALARISILATKEEEKGIKCSSW